MNGAFESFLSLPEQDKRDVYEVAASRLDTLPSYVEKDFWVCLVLDVLFNKLPANHPKLIFKGGTSLSKVFGLIRRFSEDIDLVVDRGGLGFSGEHDPTSARDLSNKKRKALFKELASVCSSYIRGGLKSNLTSLIKELAEGCDIFVDEGDESGQTLLVEYPALYPSGDVTYLASNVRIEAGARSALDPSLGRTVTPYVANELPDWSFTVSNIGVIAPERTYWEKLLILHGLYCGCRDANRLPSDTNRILRHYYDVAMITVTETGRATLSDFGLLAAVRNHNLIAFRQAWKRFEEAVPGTVRLVPQPELRTVIERGYRGLEGMILGDVPEFGWIMEQLQFAEAEINGSFGKRRPSISQRSR